MAKIIINQSGICFLLEILDFAVCLKNETKLPCLCFILTSTKFQTPDLF